jgi:hypothetical protein
MTHYDDSAEAARALAARRDDIDSWRSTHPDAEVPPSVAEVLDDQARNRSQLDRPFAAAWSLLSGGYRVLACNPAGRPLPGAEPVGDTAVLLSTWDRWPDAIAAAAAGVDDDLVAAAVTDDGMEWLGRVAVDPGTTRRPPAEAPAAETIEPGWREPDDPRPGPQTRELAGVAVRLTEVTQTPPRLASSTTAPGERGQSWGEDLAGKLRRPKPTTNTILVWSWPTPLSVKTWQLPIGRRVRAGVELLAAVPYDGAVLAIDGQHWRVSWGSGLARRQALPLWLAPEFGGKLRAP